MYCIIVNNFVIVHYLCSLRNCLWEIKCERYCVNFKFTFCTHTHRERERQIVEERLRTHAKYIHQTHGTELWLLLTLQLCTPLSRSIYFPIPLHPSHWIAQSY